MGRWDDEARTAKTREPLGEHELQQIRDSLRVSWHDW